MKKYELTDETIVVDGITLHRIRALKSFGDVKAGELGGFLEKEDNLSQESLAWVFGNARVFGTARVCDNASVCGTARVCDNASVCGTAWVGGAASVCDNARVFGDAWIFNNKSIHWIPNIGSRNDTSTFFLGKDRQIYVTCGCFYGTLDEFSEAVEKAHGNDEYGEIYRKVIELVRLRIVIPAAGPTPV